MYLCISQDDTKLFNMVLDIQGYKQLREDLDKLLDWSETWQLHFNHGKCKALHFGRNNPKKKYSIGNTTLEVVREEKDLGVIVDDQLTFHEHIATAVKKANRMLGLIKSTLKPQSHRIVRFCDRTIGCDLVSYDRSAMFAAISFYNRTLWCILYDWL